MPTPCLTVGCLSGSAVPGTAGTRYVVTKAGHLVCLEALCGKVVSTRQSDPGASSGLGPKCP